MSINVITWLTSLCVFST